MRWRYNHTRQDTQVYPILGIDVGDDVSGGLFMGKDLALTMDSIQPYIVCARAGYLEERILSNDLIRVLDGYIHKFPML